MPSSFVASQLRRTTRNLLLTNVALLALCGFVLRTAAGPIATMITGPRRVGAGELARLSRAAGESAQYVTLHADDMVEVGEKWEQNDSGERRTVAKLHLAKVGDHALLVETDPTGSGLTLTGRLEGMSPKEHAELSAFLRRDHPGVIKMVLPARLDTTKDVWGEDAFFVALLAGGVLLALWNVGRAVRRFRDPATHPSMRALAAYGGMAANAKLIDAEVAAGPVKVGRAMLTTNWLLRPTLYALRAVPFGEVVWFYKRVVRHYHNFIPTGKTFELIVHTRPAKGPLSFSAREKQVDQLLGELSRRAPWAMAGYTKELEAAMAGPQRGELIKDVHERLRQAKSAA